MTMMKMCKKYGIPICSHFGVIYACQSVNKFFMKMSFCQNDTWEHFYKMQSII
jgi:hypothetical protein